MTKGDADVLVLGLGAHGLAAVADLARRGVAVIGLDQFAPGHARGSSHGHTRMIRRAYPNAVWNDFVARAFEGWRDIEESAGRTLVHQTGGLYAHRGEAQLQGPGCVVVDSPAQMAELMPGFQVPDGYRAVYDPSAGVVDASATLVALAELAVARGAQLRWNTPVDSWERADGGVVVHTAQGDLRARRLVIAGGAWMGTLVPELADLLEVWRILTLTVAADQPIATPPSLGAFSVERDAGLLFGIPDVVGNGLKIGVDAGAIWDPRVAVDMPSTEEAEQLRSLMASVVPGIDTTPAELTACLYTMTADKRFILGSLRRAPEVIISSSCSGHGFKFTPAIGEALADLATGVQRDDLDFISTNRRDI